MGIRSSLLQDLDYIVLPHEVEVGGNQQLEMISHHDQVIKLCSEASSNRQRLCLY